MKNKIYQRLAIMMMSYLALLASGCPFSEQEDLRQSDAGVAQADSSAAPDGSVDASSRCSFSDDDKAMYDRLKDLSDEDLLNRIYTDTKAQNVERITDDVVAKKCQDFGVPAYGKAVSKMTDEQKAYNDIFKTCLEPKRREALYQKARALVSFSYDHIDMNDELVRKRFFELKALRNRMQSCESQQNE